MYPITNLEGIEKQEQKIENDHVIILLFAKPQDKNADEIIGSFNYFHKLSKDYCSIYPIGYSYGFNGMYSDVKEVLGVDNKRWQYSDECFISVCNQIQKRLKNWRYSCEPELIILKNSTDEKSKSRLNFRGYNYIDINRGINEGYLRSYSNFMENIIKACEYETDNLKAMERVRKNNISCRNIIERALKEDNTLQKSVKKILKDINFFRSYKAA